MEDTFDDFQKRFEFVTPIVIQKAMNGDYAGKTESRVEDDVSKDRGKTLLSSSRAKSKYTNDPEREAADVLKAHSFNQSF